MILCNFCIKEKYKNYVDSVVFAEGTAIPLNTAEVGELGISYTKPLTLQLPYTVNSRYNDSIYSQRRCH